MKMKMHYTVMVCLVLLAGSCTKENDQITEVIEAENAVEVEQELFSIVNDYRTSLGYNSLEYSAVAYSYANKHTDYMISKGNISHDNFSARASNISSEVNAEFVSENVAKDFNNASDVFKGWLSSASHKKTMEGEFTHTAVSVKKDATGNFYFTQLFFR